MQAEHEKHLPKCVDGTMDARGMFAYIIYKHDRCATQMVLPNKGMPAESES